MVKELSLSRKDVVILFHALNNVAKVKVPGRKYLIANTEKLRKVMEESADMVQDIISQYANKNENDEVEVIDGGKSLFIPLERVYTPGMVVLKDKTKEDEYSKAIIAIEDAEIKIKLRALDAKEKVSTIDSGRPFELGQYYEERVEDATSLATLMQHGLLLNFTE